MRYLKSLFILNILLLKVGIAQDTGYHVTVNVPPPPPSSIDSIEKRYPHLAAIKDLRRKEPPRENVAVTEGDFQGCFKSNKGTAVVCPDGEYQLTSPNPYGESSVVVNSTPRNAKKSNTYIQYINNFKKVIIGNLGQSR